ncbi:MAG: 2'-5' RNA ligase family protein [Anaerolineae bacterium]|nr:2'-5' RNA ligase family protein [Anaerolineae bacterium]
MYTIVAPVPENLAKAVEPYRQQYDPLARLAPPHIALLDPFQFVLRPETLYAHLSDIGEIHAPIKVFLVGWHVHEGKEYQLQLPMTAGQSELIALQAELLSGPLSSLAGAEKGYRPALVFGRFTQAAALEQAKRALKGFEPQFVFRVGHLELWQRDEAGQPWRVEMKFSLKATVAGRARRERAEDNV